MLAAALSLALLQSRTYFPIAFERAGEVLVVTAPGESAKKFGAGESPLVSPDGRKIAFLATEKDSTHVIRVLQISDKTSVSNLTQLPKGSIRGLAWSPDSGSLAFEHSFPEEGRTLYSWKVREQRAIGLFNVTDQEEPMNPAFNGNGTKIAILWKQAVRFINLATGSMDTIPFATLTDGLPQNSTVSTLVTKPASNTDFFYTVTFADSKVKPALFTYSFESKSVIRVSPVGYGVSNPRLCPDSRAIVFETEIEGEHWLVAMPIRGGNLTKLAQL